MFLSPFISRVGDSLYLFGLNWFVVKATNSTTLLGIVQAVGGITLLCGDLFCGVLIDNYNRKLIFLGSEFISLLACFMFATIINPVDPAGWQLITLTCMLDVGLAFSFPAAKAIVPEVLQPSALQRFNAFTNTSLNIADVITPLIGGALLTLKWIDFRSFLLFNASSFTISFLLVLGMHYQPVARTQLRLTFWRSLQSGFKYVFKNATLTENVIVSGLANVLFAASHLVLPYIVKTEYQADAEKYSILLTAMAVGGILGGIRLTMAKRPANRRDNYRDLILGGVAMLIAGFVQTYSVLLVATLVYGFAMACFNIRAFTLTQDLTANEFLGRIFGIWFIALDGVQPFGSFIFGFLTDYTKNFTLAIIGISLLLAIFITNMVFGNRVHAS